MTKAELVASLRTLEASHARDMKAAEEKFYAETQRISDGYVAKAQSMAKAAGYTSRAKAALMTRGGGGVRFHGVFDLTKVS